MLGLRARWPSWSLLRKISIILLITLGSGILYIWHLGTLTPGISSPELAARASSSSLHAIIVNPLNAPQRFIQFGLQTAGHHGAFWLRLPSVALAILFLGIFYLLAKAWFGRVVGILSTALLATTPWIILSARSETADIMLLSPIAILASYIWLMRSGNKKRELSWAVLLLTTIISLYTPGLIWLVLGGVLMARSKLIGSAKSLQRTFLGASLALAVVLLVPLILAIVKDPEVGKSLVLWPHNWDSIIIVFKSICWAGLSLVWRFPDHNDLIIGRLPILDATQIVLVIFGVYAMWAKARQQVYALKGLIIIGVIGAGINHNFTLLTLTLPAVAILTGAGLRYLYVEWRSVFPLNPIPKALAIIIMVIVVSLHIVFGVRYALVAWPHTVATRQAYVLK